MTKHSHCELIKALAKRALWLIFGSHKWIYRNPYDRRCSVCGRHEVSHCQSMKTWNNSWWEVWKDGDERKHYTSETGQLKSAEVLK